MSDPRDADAPLPSEVLMRRAGDGCEVAFETLAHRHRGGLLARFRNLGLDHGAAEDCVQDTLLRVHRASAAYEARAPFGAFLMRLARNVHVDWCRRQKLRRTPPTTLDAAAGLAEHDLPPELIDLREALTRLPARWRRVVELSVHQGLSQAEVAERLGIPVGTVKSRMHHALRKLRKMLDDG